jgi:hypothetical protein
VKIDFNRAMTRATLLEDLDYPIWRITVQKGFVTDFASVPKFAQVIYPPTGYYGHAAVLHDLLCVEFHNGTTSVKIAEHAWRPWMGSHGPAEDETGMVMVELTWRLAAYIFREQMRADGVGWRTRWAMWLAVRAFGVTVKP